MPILKHWNERGAVWGIWKVTESADDLYALLSPLSAVQSELEQLKSPSRQLEYLAVRVLIKTLLGKECLISHEPSGKPVFAELTYHLTISHTKGYVAVGIHPDKEIGIDIEYVAERVRKVTPRFVRKDELPGLENHDSSDQLYELLLVWSAKETLFKVLNLSEVDFLEHLHIKPFTLYGTGTLSGCEYRTKNGKSYIISYLTHPDFVCTYVVE